MCSELAGRAREQAEQHGLTVAPEERCLGLGVVAARLVRGRASRVGARDGARGCGRPTEGARDIMETYRGTDEWRFEG